MQLSEICYGVDPVGRRSQNYRFNPVHEQVYKQLASGVIGRPISVHFEWLLDTVHGADYFRRWHRLKDKSGGLMVHKSGHHFDLVSPPPPSWSFRGRGELT